MKFAFYPVLTFALAAVAAPVLADDATDDGMAAAQAQPAQLIEFTGDREFVKTSQRLRVWRTEVGYTLAVDAAGTPTDCELADKFRMNYVNARLCDVLIKHHTFEPARDATGAAVDGSYEGRLNLVELRDKD
jgi:hypothetical protein